MDMVINGSGRATTPSSCLMMSVMKMHVEVRGTAMQQETSEHCGRKKSRPFDFEQIGHPQRGKYMQSSSSLKQPTLILLAKPVQALQACLRST
jgi:hypothetical protein